MIDQSFVEYLVNVGKNTPHTIDLHDSGEIIVKLVVGKEGETEEHTFKKPPVERKHSFTSLEGFLDYLNSAHCKDDAGPIFVGETDIQVDLAYGKHSIQSADVSLDLSEEYSALRRLFAGLGQKDLWRELISHLDGCIDKSLLLAIGQIKLRSNNESEVRIDTTGISDKFQKDMLQIAYPDASKQGEHIATIQTDWLWMGRIWECFDREFDIRLRLEVAVTDKGLRFIFHPRRLEKILREARLALVEEIRNKIPEQFTVHEGRLRCRNY